MSKQENEKLSSMRIKYEEIEIDLWINETLSYRFINEFTHLNDVKYIGYDINSRDKTDVRSGLFFLYFTPKKELKFPKQDYYQLNNVFRGM